MRYSPLPPYSAHAFSIRFPSVRRNRRMKFSFFSLLANTRGATRWIPFDFPIFRPFYRWFFNQCSKQIAYGFDTILESRFVSRGLSAVACKKIYPWIFFEEETLNEKRFKWFLKIVLFYVDAIREKFFFLKKKTPNDETLFLPCVKN